MARRRRRVRCGICRELVAFVDRFQRCAVCVWEAQTALNALLGPR